MSIENQLKQLIIEKYGSVRAFTKIINVPYSTIDSMLKRGLEGTAVATVLIVCLALQIDIEGLLNDQIIPKNITNDTALSEIPKAPFCLSETEDRLIALHRELNCEGQEKLLDYADDLVTSGKYIKSDPAKLDKTEGA